MTQRYRLAGNARRFSPAFSSSRQWEKGKCAYYSKVGWSMKFRETKFRERIPFVFREICMFISRNKGNFAKFREIFATKFRFLLDKAKKTMLR
jgi:hypothetical protein